MVCLSRVIFTRSSRDASSPLDAGRGAAFSARQRPARRDLPMASSTFALEHLAGGACPSPTRRRRRCSFRSSSFCADGEGGHLLFADFSLAGHLGGLFGPPRRSTLAPALVRGLCNRVRLSRPFPEPFQPWPGLPRPCPQVICASSALTSTVFAVRSKNFALHTPRPGDGTSIETLSVQARPAARRP